MQLKKDYKNVVCVYKIICKPNGKILIGSTTNLYSRINHYRNDINKDNPLKHYNKSFYDDLIKYGIACFIVEIVEQFDDISAIELKNKETYYMNLFNSLDSNIGYNIRQDIDGKYVCANSTKEIKRLQTFEQWHNGIRNNHSIKMQNYWKDNNTRKLQQSSIMSKNKTKYKYTIINKSTNKIIKQDVGYTDLFIPNYNPCQIQQRFCYVNKKANNKNKEKSPFALKTIVDTISIGQYIISRTRI